MVQIYKFLSLATHCPSPHCHLFLLFPVNSVAPYPICNEFPSASCRWNPFLPMRTRSAPNVLIQGAPRRPSVQPSAAFSTRRAYLQSRNRIKHLFLPRRNRYSRPLVSAKYWQDQRAPPECLTLDCQRAVVGTQKNARRQTGWMSTQHPARLPPLHLDLVLLRSLNPLPASRPAALS